MDTSAATTSASTIRVGVHQPRPRSSGSGSGSGAAVVPLGETVCTPPGLLAGAHPVQLATGWTRTPPDGDDVAVTSRTLLDDLDARGLVQDSTDRAALAARLAEGPLTIYYGCDPSADSLHVGNLIGLVMLRRFQDAGHRPVALAGGATGMIGDPGGRSEERNLLDDATLTANVAAIKAQIARVVDFDDGRALLVDNRDWTADIRVLDFLRD